MSQDDLSFDEPANADLPPSQVFTAGNSKRQSEGHYSWMATLVPTSESGDLYTVSVGVFYQRDLSSINETLVGIDFYGGGWGGGDATFTGTPDVQVGQWIMVSGGGEHRWYRIVSAAPPSGGQRDVTLAGPDWTSGSGQATIVQGVVADGGSRIEIPISQRLRSLGSFFDPVLHGSLNVNSTDSAGQGSFKPRVGRWIQAK